MLRKLARATAIRIIFANPRQKLTAAFLIIALSLAYPTYSYAFGCSCGFSIAGAISQFAALLSTTIASKLAAAAAIASSIFQSTERVTSSIAAMVKGQAMHAQTISKTAVEAQERLAQARAAIETQRRTQEAAVRFSGEFGQGFQPCRIIMRQEQIARTQNEAPAEIRKNTSLLQAAPGRYAPRDEEENSLASANKLCCTADLAAKGFCDKPDDDNSSLDGACFNVQALLEESEVSDGKSEIKKTIINNLAGYANIAPREDAVKTPEGQAAASAKMGVDARRSPALVSLEALAFDTTAQAGSHASEHGDDAEGLSLDKRFEREAARYMGAGPEALEWARVMAQQETRGVLVELLKTKALDLAIMERQYKQYERIEAVLAGLTAQAAQSYAVNTQRLGAEASLVGAQ